VAPGLGGYFNRYGYADFYGAGGTDYNIRAEMVAQMTDDSFWVVFGTNSDSAASDESYGISNIQIWVR
jgi:hypothetical protein